ncbi:MAG: flagellar motor protein MotB [Pseudomonadota bacterium]
MPPPPDERPIIIKKKKVVSGDGHHGGAWKVAYADFVTAMMAFFMLMWLLNATTEQQRKGLADYFSPTIPITRISGGGDGSFGGDDVFSENSIAQNGTGASDQRPSEGRQSLGITGSEYEEDESAEQAALESLGRALDETGGDSLVTELVLRHVQTRLTDEGLIIEIFSLPDAPLFDESGEFIDWLPLLTSVIADLFGTVTNQVAVHGYVASEPLVRATDDRFDLSTSRAAAIRRLLEESGLATRRIERLTGYGDRVPVTDDPISVRNDRIEIILLRDRV